MEDQTYSIPTSFDTDFKIGFNKEVLEREIETFNTESSKFADAITELKGHLESFKSLPGIKTEDADYFSSTYVNSENGPIKKLENCKNDMDKIKTELIPAIDQALKDTQTNIKAKIDEAIH